MATGDLRVPRAVPPQGRGAVDLRSRLDVEAVAELWFAEVERMVEEGERSPGTLDTYRHVYRNHVAPALGSLRVREVTTPVVDRVLMVMKRQSTAIARLARTIVAGIMRYAARHGAVRFNPVREVARIEGTPKRRPRALTADERQQWLNAVESNDAARRWDLPDLTRLMLATGCRVGECLALGWTEVDLDAATADICCEHDERRRGGAEAGVAGRPGSPASRPGRAAGDRRRVRGLRPAPGDAPRQPRHRRDRDLDLPCGSTRAAVCPSCAGRARKLRAQQCREGWHLTEDPDLTPKPATENQRDLVKERAHVTDAVADAEDAGDDLTAEACRESAAAVDQELTATGVRGQLDADSKARRVRSTRRRQDTPDLPRRAPVKTTLGRTFTDERTGKTFRPSLFVTLTLPSYGPRRDDSMPVDPTRYDYRPPGWPSPAPADPRARHARHVRRRPCSCRCVSRGRPPRRSHETSCAR